MAVLNVSLFYELAMLRVVKMPPLPQPKNKPNPKPNSSKAIEIYQLTTQNNCSNKSLSLSRRRNTPQRPYSTKSNKSTKSNTSSQAEILLRGNSPRAKALLRMPNISAKSWVIFEMKQNRCLYGKRNFKKRQIASLTKIMNLITILSLVEKLKVDPSKLKGRVTQKISGTTGTTAGLRQNGVYSLLDLYYGMMLPSGNDAALMIAAIGGCLIKASNQGIPKQKLYHEQELSFMISQGQNSAVGGYLREMNRLAKQIGMYSTNFANTHGLSNVYSFSTASDVAKLCCFAMKNSVFRKIVYSQAHDYAYILEQKAQIGGQNLSFKENIDPNLMSNRDVWRKEGRWENTNKLLGEGWSGIKTGITPNAGPCLAASSIRTIGGREYEFGVVLLKSKSMQARWEQAKALVDWIIETRMYHNSYYL